MKNKFKIPLTIILLFFMLITCIDPFNPNLKGTASVIVVDALLTDENRSYTVELSRTSQTQNSDPVMVSWAYVEIRDNIGSSITLQETTAGVYKTDSLYFRGKTGHSYTLYIRTFEGTEYESDPCIMYPVNKIDSIYFRKEQEFQNNGSVIQDGIRIFIDSENSGDGTSLRWIYHEWWKFRVPSPKLYDYTDEFNISPVDQVKEVCWSFGGSDDITIKSTEGMQSNRIEKEPILFVATDKSDRFLIQYCIDIRQLSISQKEFDFWDHMNQINESGGDIFEKQPFSIVGNIHNISNPGEQVLGYFQVSAVEKKRIYITPDEISELNLPIYQYDCENIAEGPDDYPPSQDTGAKMTFDKIYKYYIDAGYYFIRPIYNMMGGLQRLVFTKPSCAVCTKNGSLTKPDFWIDLDLHQRKK
jgi:hypothetical protein